MKNEIDVPVQVTEDKGPVGGTLFDHPSFVQISFSRVQGGRNQFFGYDLEVNNFIKMTISESEKRKDLLRDWYFPKKTILECDMTESQFATLITTLNSGSGTPASLSYKDGVIIKLPKNYQETPTQEFQKDIKERVKNAKQGISLIVKALRDSKGVMSRKEQQELLSAAYTVQNEIEANTSFVMNSFKEKMDTLISEAKTEVEAFTEGVLARTGMLALKDNDFVAKLMIENGKEEK